MKTFEELGLEPRLLRAIEEMGFENPMPVQEQVIPLLLQDHADLVGLAQTGTGKTAAFGLPLAQLIKTNDKHTQALILCPTRELCLQIARDLGEFTKYIDGLNIVSVYGGASIETQIKEIARGAHIVVATPGRLVDLLNRRKINLTSIRVVVLDEADEMLNMGFQDDLNMILSTTPENRSTLLFSATMPREVASIAKNYMNNPVEITIGQRNAGATTVRHTYYMTHAKDRYLALKRIVDYNVDIYGIIFCRTRRETQEISDKLIQDGYSADSLRGDLSQAQRDSVMLKFRNKNLQMLVATDVAARGLDVNDLTHVINYNLPDDIEVYTHRSGRTGRAGKSGISIAIINMKEKYLISQIERMINKKFERVPIPGGKDVCEKQLFNLVDKMEKVEVDHEKIDLFLPDIYKKLEWMSREELIKHFVSLEFNRFLEYYRNAPDLNINEDRERKGEKDRDHGRGRERERGSDRSYGRERERDSDRGRNRDRDSDRPRPRRGSESFTRFFLSMGKMDGVTPPNIIGLINDGLRDKSTEIGKIDILRNFSFFEIASSSADKLLDAYKSGNYQGKPITLQIAQERENRESMEFREDSDFKQPRREKRKRR